MPMTVAQLQVMITANTSGAEKGIKGVSDSLSSASGGMKGFLSNVAGFAAAIGVTQLAGDAFGFVKDQLSEAYSAGLSANQVLSQTAAVLTSTHDASGQTTQSIAALATQIMGMSGIQDDAVESGENMLLTFDNIGKNVFPQATKTLADMATAMNGGAIPSSQQMRDTAIQLGKALNDPATGLTALQRVGVTFTAQQKAQIQAMQAAGDTAGAQKVILQELNKEFGGSAAAAGQANGGIGILSAQLDNMRQTIGQAVIPVVSQFAKLVTPLALSLANDLTGAVQHVSGLLTSGMGPALGSIGAILAPVAQAFQLMAQHLQSEVGPALAQVATFGQTTLMPMLGQFATIVATVVIPIVDTLASFFIQHVLPAAMSLVSFFQASVLPVITTLGQVLAKDVIPTVTKLAGAILDQLLPPLERIAGAVLPILNPLFQALGWVIGNVVGPVLGLVIDLLGFLLDKLADVVTAISSHVGPIFSWLGTQVHNAVDSIRTQFENTIAFWSGLGGRIRSVITDNIVNPVKNTITGLASDAQTWGRNLIQMFINGIMGMIGNVRNAASNLMGQVKNILGFHSPAAEGPGADADTWSPNLMKMFAGGIESAAPSLQSAASQAIGAVKAGLTGSNATASLGINAAGAGGGLAPSAGLLNASGIGVGVSGAAGQPIYITVNSVLDGKTLAQSTVKYLPNVIRTGTGLRNW